MRQGRQMIDNRQRAQPGEYRAYLVRLWREAPDDPWRAMAKDAHTGEEHHFASVEQLFVFLHDQTAGQQV